MNKRQKNALAHPVPFSRLGEFPHRARVTTIGNRTEVLDVREALDGKWVWQASYSYQGSGGGSKPLGMWTQQNAERADIALTKLLHGVGEDLVFRIVPVDAELQPWPGSRLRVCSVENDPDVAAYVHEWLGADFPAVPVQFGAMHAWKRLTDAELEKVTQIVGGSQ